MRIGKVEELYLVRVCNADHELLTLAEIASRLRDGDAQSHKALVCECHFSLKEGWRGRVRERGREWEGGRERESD